jgi:hypothetical protein
MAQRYNEGNKIQLKVEKSFINPVQTLPVGSKGTVLLRMSDKTRYRIQFDDRTKMSIISDRDLI